MQVSNLNEIKEELFAIIIHCCSIKLNYKFYILLQICRKPIKIKKDFLVRKLLVHEFLSKIFIKYQKWPQKLEFVKFFLISTKLI